MKDLSNFFHDIRQQISHIFIPKEKIITVVKHSTPIF
jgi:hypothetical protein